MWAFQFLSTKTEARVLTCEKMVFGRLAWCSILHPKSEGRGGQLQPGEDKQMAVRTLLSPVSLEEGSGLPVGRRPRTGISPQHLRRPL